MENLQKNKRGRLSKIELLPEKIKRKLDKMLISRKYSQAVFSG
ncbi:TPA: DUF3486 family protein [Escherichia coli]|nr:DUF3486 family protein [Escherichia coli]